MRFTSRSQALAVAGAVAVVALPVVASGWLVGSRGDAPVSDAYPRGTPGNVVLGDPPAPPSGDEGGDGTASLRRADAADPFVVVDGRPWLFTTNNAAGNVPVVTGAGTDDVVVSDALPVLPAWSVPGFTWAPAVTPTDDGWVLAFTARHRASGHQCIGVATSPTVDGPYAPQPAPLVCDLDHGGSIDPSFVADGAGRRWLLYKDDGNCCGLPTALHTVPLNPSATALAGSPALLLTADQPWEGGLVEAPSMAEVGDRWLLLYSGNRWDTAGYAVGAAWCDTPVGPCHKQPSPALTAGAGLDGPGGVEFVSGLDSDGVAVTFHAWPDGDVGYDDGSTRRLRVGRVEITVAGVSIAPRRLAAR
jgi:arabinan endo-1,5-alpha-L-arabinosidase